MNQRMLGAAAVAASAFLFSAPTTSVAEEVTGSFSRTLAVDAPLELDVRTGSGSIEVREGGADEVRVVGRISARDTRDRSVEETEQLVRRLEMDPPIELSDDRLLIGHIEDEDARRNVSISYDIEVPAETSVRSRSGSGRQTISGVEGPVEASTGSGNVTLREIGGAVDARTGSGSIDATGIAGAFNAHTGSGRVALVQTSSGDVDVTTGSGGSRLSGVEGALRVRAGSGSIEVEGVPTGSWDVETGSGSIVLRLPQDTGFEVRARSGSGGVNIDHPVSGRLERGGISGVVRGGGPEIVLRTGSGGIRIE